MDDEETAGATERIEAALARISAASDVRTESAAPEQTSDRSNDGSSEKHRMLVETVKKTLEELDTLIAELDR